jgi:condensin complex subunit 3
MNTIPDVLNECQKTFAVHRKCLKALRKIQSQDPKKFIKDFVPYLNRVLVVFKREPAVERVVQFVVNFATYTEGNSRPNENFAIYVIGYLLQYTNVKEKAVRFRSTQIIANIINSMSEESEIE